MIVRDIEQIIRDEVAAKASQDVMLVRVKQLGDIEKEFTKLFDATQM